jgi:hypothetical protein
MIDNKIEAFILQALKNCDPEKMTTSSPSITDISGAVIPLEFAKKFGQLIVTDFMEITKSMKTKHKIKTEYGVKSNRKA